MIRNIEDQKWKVIYLHPNDILQKFIKPNYNYETICHTFVNLPKDVIIDSIHFDMTRQSFCFLLYSKEFDVVPYGMIPPTIHSEVKAFSVEEWLIEREKNGTDQI